MRNNYGVGVTNNGVARGIRGFGRKWQAANGGDGGVDVGESHEAVGNVHNDDNGEGDR